MTWQAGGASWSESDQSAPARTRLYKPRRTLHDVPIRTPYPHAPDDLPRPFPPIPGFPVNPARRTPSPGFPENTVNLTNIHLPLKGPRMPYTGRGGRPEGPHRPPSPRPAPLTLRPLNGFLAGRVGQAKEQWTG